MNVHMKVICGFFTLLSIYTISFKTTINIISKILKLSMNTVIFTLLHLPFIKKYKTLSLHILSTYCQSLVPNPLIEHMKKFSHPKPMLQRHLFIPE